MASVAPQLARCIRAVRLGGVLFFLAVPAGCTKSPYGDEWVRLYEERQLIADPDDRTIHLLAQSRYFDENKARPFEEVLAEVREEYLADVGRIHNNVTKQREYQRQIVEAEAELERTLLEIESSRRDRLWAQEAKLRSISIGDQFSIAEIGVPDRTIDLVGGRTMLIFERLETIGVNTTITLDSDGRVTEVARYP